MLTRFYPLARAALFAMEPEDAHEATLKKICEDFASTGTF